MGEGRRKPARLASGGDCGSYGHRIATTAFALAIWILTAIGCDSEPASESTSVDASGATGVEVRLPPGWHAIRGPVSAITEPAQAVAAASLPLRLGPPKSGCSPDVLLERLPPDQVAVQILEVTQGPGGSDQPRLHAFPRRPARFALDADSFDTYECSGPSHSIPFRDHDRGFHAYVWLNPARVDPKVRAQTVALLNSLEISR